MIPLRFMSRQGVYVFPPGLTQNTEMRLGGLVSHTNRLPGMDGAFDQYGHGPSPLEVGNVRVTFGLVDESGEALDAQRDAVMALASWGKGMLVAQPTIPGAKERYCWARANNIRIAETPSGDTELIQQVTIDFQVAEARWHVNRFSVGRWGYGLAWGGGSKWGGDAPVQACAGMLTAFEVDNAGIAPALPRIVIAVGPGQSVTSWTLERVVGVTIADRVSLAGPLAAGDVVDIDCRAAAVRMNYEDAYSRLTALRPSWMELPPGESALIVRMGAGDACSVRLTYEDEYL